MPILIIQTSSNTSEYHIENSSKISIGSSLDCDIVLHSQHISYYHSVIILMVDDYDFYWVIKDGHLRKQYSASDRGTFVNNVKIQKITRLHHLDFIKFDDISIFPYIIFVITKKHDVLD